MSCLVHERNHQTNQLKAEIEQLRKDLDGTLGTMVKMSHRISDLIARAEAAEAAAELLQGVLQEEKWEHDSTIDRAEIAEGEMKIAGRLNIATLKRAEAAEAKAERYAFAVGTLPDRFENGVRDVECIFCGCDADDWEKHAHNCIKAEVDHD